MQHKGNAGEQNARDGRGEDLARRVNDEMISCSGCSEALTRVVVNN